MAIKYFEKDGVTFQSASTLEENRLKKAGYKEVSTPRSKKVKEGKVEKKEGGE